MMNDEIIFNCEFCAEKLKHTFISTFMCENCKYTCEMATLNKDSFKFTTKPYLYIFNYTVNDSYNNSTIIRWMPLLQMFYVIKNDIGSNCIKYNKITPTNYMEAYNLYLKLEILK